MLALKQAGRDPALNLVELARMVDTVPPVFLTAIQGGISLFNQYPVVPKTPSYISVFHLKLCQ